MRETPEHDHSSGDPVLHGDIEAIVRFFDPAKGYGFVQVSDGSPDAFLPATAVERANCPDLEAGDIVFCEIVPGPKSPMVSIIHYVDRNPFGKAAGHAPVTAEGAPVAGNARVKRAGHLGKGKRSAPR